ncbi:threonylcarbamoyl-AMP synthase [Paenibacillus sp. HN-1]|uniref:L-threonylcarbamoyladenylate synthase n=1 Tax=Paenibacillus TaxID=44249 RepID=UPI001CA81344|nr:MULTISPECIES: L-threonylcarbamoyladenylate synthase [Paenibacillus]MBY9077658.1 threonylcarbamoyl-AMP synthase [Paenibacillus sp. CGMCC 1.18879]MBY9087417.1 threonylcarbamoyl-AMP synthase [Paenibacillus sinensis]
METKVWKLNTADDGAEPWRGNADDLAALEEAVVMLREGRTVAFPTETVYGLGADARLTEAVEAIFEAKGRPSDNPLIVHIADRTLLEELVTEVPEEAWSLMDAYWPGPLTIVLPVRPGAVSPRVTAGLDTIGVRMPDHPVALALLKAAGCPVAAPSANRSGRPSPTLATHVLDDLAGRIGGVLDGGASGVGLESTVVQVQPDGSIAVLRPGGVTAQQLSAAAGGAPVTGADAAADFTPPDQAEAGGSTSPAPRAPGMKYAHYAPRGALSVVTGSSPELAAKRAAALLAEARARGEVTGLMLFEEHRSLYPDGAASCVVSLGALASPEQAAHSLYAALREFDEVGAGYILAEACPETGLGSAIMNRLMKAAAGRVIDAG